ncbi:MAG: AAA family ATPase [Pseudomonadota bacterium]
MDKFIDIPTEISIIGEKPIVYVPVKEMLASAPGFRSLYSSREIYFEEVYLDILDKAYLPPLKKLNSEYQPLLDRLRQGMKGEVKLKGETFYLLEKAGEIEFSLVAEGLRKLALLWLLIRNGSLTSGATLFWDEPETNLNPSMLPMVVDILLRLVKLGVQIFIATHSYPLLKEFDLQHRDRLVRYFNLRFNVQGLVRVDPVDRYDRLTPNKIDEEYTRIYDLEIERALGHGDE